MGQTMVHKLLTAANTTHESDFKCVDGKRTAM